MGFLDEKYLLGSETAFAIYNTIENLPIVDPHSHVDVQEIASNKKYSDPWQLFGSADHYVWSAMRKRGVQERFITGDAKPKEKWLKLTTIFPELAGNPLYEWMHLELRRYLGIETVLSPETGEDVWEQAKAVFAVNSKHPQALLKEMNISVVCSTDDPLDTLEHHASAAKGMDSGTAIKPTWRPDKAVNILAASWPEYIAALAARFNKRIVTLEGLVETLESSHDFFASQGCVASDHGLSFPISGEASKEDAETAFKKALAGQTITQAHAEAYMSYLTARLAEMDASKDWVFQLHIGAMRNVRSSLFESIGPDSGGDISCLHFDMTVPLGRFLNKFDGRLKTVLYCLDPAHQASLATISRAFGSKVALGSAWWFNDTPIGMRRQLEYIASVDMLSNFAGMVSDSRKILSCGSRFEVFRRVLADTLATMVERGQMPYPLAETLAERVCQSGPKSFFNL